MLSITKKQKIKIELSALIFILLLIQTGCRKDSGSTESGVSIPEAPTLLNPPNDTTITSTAVKLSWMAAEGSTSYTVQISNDSSFSILEYNQGGITGLIKEVTGLSNSTRYFWRVRASNNYGSSQWSSPIWCFTIGTILQSIPCPAMATVTYAGKTYNTVLIGNQCWLKENLDVGTMVYRGNIPSNNGIIEKHCYYDLPHYCNSHGGLYTWDEAMNYLSREKSQGICPTGWHIPSYTELQTLSTTVNNDGNALKGIGQGSGEGEGTNISGFSALLAGYLDNGGDFYYLNVAGYFWSSTMFNTINIYNSFLFYDSNHIYFNNSNKEFSLSIRCVMDNRIAAKQIKKQ